MYFAMRKRVWRGGIVYFVKDQEAERKGMALLCGLSLLGLLFQWGLPTAPWDGASHIQLVLSGNVFTAIHPVEHPVSLLGASKTGQVDHED